MYITHTERRVMYNTNRGGCVHCAPHTEEDGLHYTPHTENEGVHYKPHSTSHPNTPNGVGGCTLYT